MAATEKEEEEEVEFWEGLAVVVQNCSRKLL
jgi:hypothetical protein